MLKTVTYAAMHFSIAFAVVYLMTGSVALGGAVALVEPLCNTVGYFVHEKAWERFGRHRRPRGEDPAGVPGPVTGRA